MEGLRTALHRQLLVCMVAGSLVLSVLVGAASGVRGRQDAPAWSQGDFWEWAWIVGSSAYTRTWTAKEQTSGPLPSRNMTLWHVAETVVKRTALANTTYTRNVWIRLSDYGLAMEDTQTDAGRVSVIWDPPISKAVFPLDDNGWTGSARGNASVFTIPDTHVEIRFVNYSARALAEMDVAIPAGSFHVVPILFTQEGLTTSVAYYSDVVGNFVLVQDYSLGTIIRTESLTQYQHGLPAYVVPLFLGAGGAVAVILAVLVVRRFRDTQAGPRQKPTEAQEPAPELRESARAERRR